MKKFNNIIFVNDSGDYDDNALKQAVDLARINKAQLTLIRCFNNLKKLSQNQPKHNILIQEMLDYKYEALKEKIKGFSNDVDIEVKVFLGKPFIEVIREVIDYEVDLVIKAIEKSGFKNMLFDSLDLKLLRKCPCPVWLIKSNDEVSEKKILVAIDHEPENPENESLNKHLLELAASFAKAQSAEMHVIHAWTFENENLLRSVSVDYKPEEIDLIIKKDHEKRYQWLNETVGRCLSSLDESHRKSLITSLHLIEGYAAFKIPELAQKIHAELLIMGTVGRTGIPGFIIGNTAESILFNVDCSVLAVKPDGFVSPVISKEPND